MFMLGMPCILNPQNKGRIETRTLLSTKSQSSGGPQAGGSGEGHAARWAHKADRQPWSPNNGLSGETNRDDCWSSGFQCCKDAPLSEVRGASLSC